MDFGDYSCDTTSDVGTEISDIQSFDSLDGMETDVNTDLDFEQSISNDLNISNDIPADNPTETVEFEPLVNEDVSNEINEKTDINEWIHDINPNFDPFDVESDYSNNCGSCAYAVYQRLEGDSDACATATNIGYNSEMEALTGLEQVSMSPEEIQERLLAEGDGAHAIIGIDREVGPGHWFNAACIDGKVVAIDGQTGEISDWPPDMGNVTNWEMSVRKRVA